jgi:hypothetical protein
VAHHEVVAERVALFEQRVGDHQSPRTRSRRQ